MLALVDVSMSRQPAKNKGLLATIPTGCPSILAKPTVMFFAQSGMISKYVLSSTTCYGHKDKHRAQCEGACCLLDDSKLLHGTSKLLLPVYFSRVASHADRPDPSSDSPTKR